MVLLRCLHAFDVLPGSHTQGAILISDVVTTQVEFHLACALKLELVGLGHEGIDDCLRVLGCDHQIIHIDTNVLVVVTCISHPHVTFRL